MSSGVFVLGMHRSGTSAVTRVVNLLGIPTVEAADVKRADSRNPRGYWESVSLLKLNDRVLAAHGGDLVAPPNFRPGWERDPRLANLQDEARGILGRVLPTREWVWKDPRNCLTFPFWLTAADVRPAVVLVYRHPLEVAESMFRLGGNSGSLSLALWERYNRAALVAATGLPTFVVRYERLVRLPTVVGAELVDFLRDEGFGVDETAVRELADFIDANLRRSRRDAVAEELSPTQMQLFRTLKTLDGAHRTLAPPPLPAETSWVEPLLAERRRVLGLERKCLRLADELKFQYARRNLFGLEVSVLRGGPAWRVAAPLRRLLPSRR